MPVFRVRRRVDAYVDYVARVGADTPENAAEFARENEEHFDWEEDGVREFDSRLFVTLDPEGCEIDGTQVGDA